MPLKFSSVASILMLSGPSCSRTVSQHSSSRPACEIVIRGLLPGMTGPCGPLLSIRAGTGALKNSVNDAVRTTMRR
jgi:hypothetical protein